MTDADTSRNLRWQRDVNGDAAKFPTWQIEATSLPGLHFFAYMQPGEAFLSGGTLSVHNLLNRHRYSVLPWQDCPLLWGPERNAGMRPGGVASSERIRVEEMHGA